MTVTKQQVDRVGRLAVQLQEAFQPFLDGTPEDRDWLVNAHGWKMGPIYQLMHAFSKPPEKREENLRLSFLIPWPEEETEEAGQ